MIILAAGFGMSTDQNIGRDAASDHKNNQAIGQTRLREQKMSSPCQAGLNQAAFCLPYFYRLFRRAGMEQNQSKPRVAKPAEEEIKKHGDQLARQVNDAAGKSKENRPDQTNLERHKE